MIYDGWNMEKLFISFRWHVPLIFWSICLRVSPCRFHTSSRNINGLLLRVGKCSCILCHSGLRQPRSQPLTGWRSKLIAVEYNYYFPSSVYGWLVSTIKHTGISVQHKHNALKQPYYSYYHVFNCAMSCLYMQFEFGKSWTSNYSSTENYAH